MIEKYIQRLRKIIADKKTLIVYIVSGVTALVADYIVFIILYYVCHLPVEVSAPIGLTVGLITSFLMNRLWTFRDQSSSGGRQAAIQVVMYLVLFAFNNLFTVVLINFAAHVGIQVAVSKVLATVIITLWNYVLYKKFIFK